MFQILTDISYIIKEKYKIIGIYFMLMGLYLYMIYKNIYGGGFVDYEYINIVLNLLFALDINILGAEDIFFTVMTLLQYLFFIYIALCLFVKDYDLFDNYFTRITFRKWFLYKIFINLMFIILFHLIFYSIILILIDYNILPLIIIGKKVLLLISMIIYVYIIMTYFYKSKIKAGILSFIGIIPFMFHVNIRTVNIGVLLVILFILMMIIIFGFKRKRFSDLEIERGMSWK